MTDIRDLGRAALAAAGLLLALRAAPAWAGSTERVSVASAAAGRPTGQLLRRRSRPTGASSPSSRSPPTLSRAIPTASPTLRPRSAAGTTERVSVGPGGRQADGDSVLGPSLSADGRFVAFLSTPPTSCRATPTARTISSSATASWARPSGSAWRRAGVQANGRQPTPAISADGRFVAFVSSATNLVPGDTNGQRARLRPRPQAGTTERVSVAPDGAQPPVTAPARRSRRTGASSPSCVTPRGRPYDTICTVDIFRPRSRGGMTKR